MTLYTCPKGHSSAEGDFCDTCGARIGAAPTTGSPVTAAPAPAFAPASAPGPASASASASADTAPPTVPDIAPAAAEPPCPNCGAPRGASARFCEDCGYDHSTGRVPQLGPPGGGPLRGDWTATVFADRVYFDANEVDGVTFPAGAPRRDVTLPAPQVRIGRRSSSQGTEPDLDLSDDPGVSHNHALLTLNIDGQWLVSDLGSTNGTYLNEEDAPLTAGQTRTLKDGDQVHVGIWTTITLHAPS
ncbi:FHA domain-containing protein [Actinoplanes sp. DH11]|uniref:FHA domain-containing protein n=1 Tax=Actinoplanes sp. DH11 TaxID=2857011 RepID=UPI001E54AFB1|nr:FHA domain-containing protein [Actinoplanes sp. DH11]